MRNTYDTAEHAMHNVTRSQLEAMRPGCTAFLDLPSLRNGERLPFTPPRIDMVGKLADQTNLARD